MENKHKLPPLTRVGVIRLRVANLILMRGFYEDVMGLEPLQQDSRNAILGIDGRPIVELISLPGGNFGANRPGLFHLAILLPERAWLGAWLRHYLKAGYQLTGASDHLVSEALYLNDPEGNGIEIYRDRPRDQWKGANGEIQMATNRLDLQALFQESEIGEWTGKMPAGSRLGHVHLQVNDLGAALQFYRDVIGLQRMVSYPGAEFLAAGGYHHHLGINTWNSAAAATRSEDLLGLDSFSLLLPDETARDKVVNDVSQNGIDLQIVNNIPVVADPAGNRLTLEIDK